MGISGILQRILPPVLIAAVTTLTYSCDNFRQLNNLFNLKGAVNNPFTMNFGIFRLMEKFVSFSANLKMIPSRIAMKKGLPSVWSIIPCKAHTEFCRLECAECPFCIV